MFNRFEFGRVIAAVVLLNLVTTSVRIMMREGPDDVALDRVNAIWREEGPQSEQAVADYTGLEQPERPAPRRQGEQQLGLAPGEAGRLSRGDPDHATDHRTIPGRGRRSRRQRQSRRAGRQGADHQANAFEHLSEREPTLAASADLLTRFRDAKSEDMQRFLTTARDIQHDYDPGPIPSIAPEKTPFSLEGIGKPQ